MRELEQTLERLAEVSRMMDEATEELHHVDNEFVVLKVEHMKAYARAFLGATGSMDIRRAQAELECIDAYSDRELAEVRLRSVKERLRTLRDQMELLRTTAAAQRAQWMAEPTGQWS